jgi:hypothetical protein
MSWHFSLLTTAFFLIAVVSTALVLVCSRGNQLSISQGGVCSILHLGNNY